MRSPAALLLLTLAVLAQDSTVETGKHDELGFPVTFNDEIITRRDVLRRIGAPEEAVGPGTLGSQLNQVMRDKLTERLAELWGIRISDSMVRQSLRREMEAVGGEAKFYLKLAQRGDTLARYQEELRLTILKAHLRYMLMNGFSPSQDRFLPWDLKPTPSEIKRAFERDTTRRDAGPRVRLLVLRIRLDGKTRKNIVGQSFLKGEDGPEWMKKELQRRTEILIAEAEAELKRVGDFEKVLTARGLDLEEARNRWFPLPKEPTGDADDAFLRTAGEGTWSEPLRQAQGDARILYLLEREDPHSRGVHDRDVYVHYRDLIKAARQDKMRHGAGGAEPLPGGALPGAGRVPQGSAGRAARRRRAPNESGPSVTSSGPVC